MTNRNDIQFARKPYTNERSAYVIDADGNRRFVSVDEAKAAETRGIMRREPFSNEIQKPTRLAYQSITAS
jgi:hypothetical protein